MAERDDLSTRELGRRRGTAISAALLAAGVTGTIGLAGWTAWAHAQDTARSTATAGTDDGIGRTGITGDDGPGFGQAPPDQGFGQGQGLGQSQSGQGQSGQGQQGGGFPQLGGAAGPGQAGSAGS